MDYRQLFHQANALAAYSNYSSAYNHAAASNARTYSYRLWTLANVLTNDSSSPCACSIGSVLIKLLNGSTLVDADGPPNLTFCCFFIVPSGSSSTGRQEVVAEYFAKCWLCSKGFPSSSVLRDHLQTVHNESAAAAAAAMAALQPSVQATSNSTNTTTSSSSSNSSSSMTTTHKHTCLQCNASFSERDELERHELTHSPTAQVVRTAVCLLCSPISAATRSSNPVAFPSAPLAFSPSPPLTAFIRQPTG